jgi:TRAP-type mannitol/chloroaromatic compound transport system permease small subunit
MLRSSGAVGPIALGLAGLVRHVERFNRAIGEVAAWLVLAVVLVCAAVALLRYGLGFGRIWLQELYVVLFGVSFLLASPRAYAEDAHIRIDVLSERFSHRTKALVELLGCALFLVPWLLVVAWSSWPFVRLSWLVREPSPQSGGLPGLYVVKTAIPLFAVLMLLQTAAVMARSLLVLLSRDDLLPPPRRRASIME